MAQLAVEAAVEHPIAGVGAGGYRAWMDEADPVGGTSPHAHNSVLHIGATLGLVGLGLWAFFFWVLLRGAGRIWDEQQQGPYGLGPMFAIVGLLLASSTDVVHLNQQTAAMIGLLAALSPAICPGHPLWRRGDPDIDGAPE